jgi:hypothetical protein
LHRRSSQNFNLADLKKFFQHYGALAPDQLPAAAIPASVPEPSRLMSILAGAFVLRRRRR